MPKEEGEKRYVKKGKTGKSSSQATEKHYVKRDQSGRFTATGNAKPRSAATVPIPATGKRSKFIERDPQPVEADPTHRGGGVPGHITLNLPSDLRARLKQEATERGQNIEVCVIDAIRQAYPPVEATVTVAVEAQKPVMLDQMLAGRTGTIRSNGGKGGSRLSENTGKAFMDYVVRKHREGRL